MTDRSSRTTASAGRVMRALLTAHLVAVRGDGLYPDGSQVISLTKAADVPRETDAKQPFMMVEFYSAWCGHCQHFAPTYEEIAEAAKTQLPDLQVAAINCAEYSDICTDHHVSSYPTLVIFPGAEKFSGMHSPTKLSVLDWAQKHRPAGAAAAAAAASETVREEDAEDLLDVMEASLGKAKEAAVPAAAEEAAVPAAAEEAPAAPPPLSVADRMKLANTGLTRAIGGKYVRTYVRT